MICLTQTYLNQYIYSPITSCHRMNLYTKIYITYTVMFILLYLGLSKFLMIITLIFFTFIILELYNKPKFLMLNIVLDKLVYLVHTCILNHFISSNEVKEKDMVISKLIILNHIQIDINNNTCKLKYYHIIYCLPKYLLKIIYLYTVSSNINLFLFMCTQSHVIIETIIYYLKNMQISAKRKCNKGITYLYLAYQSLENIIKVWINSSIGKQLKTRFITTNIKFHGLIILMTYYMNILAEENNSSITLWNRDLLYNNFTSFKYYY